VLDDELAFGIKGQDAGEFTALRSGSVKELLSLKLAQSFDINENSDDLDPDRNALSDMAAVLAFYPNEHVAIGARTDYNVEDTEFSSYGFETQFVDKRGDELRMRFRFVDEEVRQLETGVEVRVTEDVRLGYYSRYDDLEGEFLENKIGMRLVSACDCWLLDFEFRDRINPNKSEFGLTLTLIGLGELGNTFFQRREEEQQS
jgi:hypothetical protein